MAVYSNGSMSIGRTIFRLLNIILFIGVGLLRDMGAMSSRSIN